MSTPTSLHTYCHLEAEKTKLTGICDPLIPIIRYSCYKHNDEERSGQLELYNISQPNG